MIVPPTLFLIVSVVLWRMFSAPFIPELLANRLLQVLPQSLVGPGIGPFLTLSRQLALAHFFVLYYGGYFLFSYLWKRLKRTFKNPFLGAMALWLLNVLVILPLAGRGVFGYKLPQGAVSVSILILAAHWVFARSLELRS